MRVLLVTVDIDDEDRKALEGAAGPDVQVVALQEVKDSLEELAPQVEVILGAGLRSITPDTLQKMKSLRLVQLLLAGVDHLPATLFRPEVKVHTVSGVGSDRIAEHAMALLLSSARNIPLHTANIRSGKFDRSPVNLSLKGKTLGVLGLGNVGRGVAGLGSAFGMRILAINRTGQTEEPVEFVGTLQDLHQVLRDSDFVVLCLSLNRRTKGLIGSEELDLMKPDAILVNVGRAGVVQEEALFQHLRATPTFRAAFDVWWTYPKGGNGRPFYLPFHEQENFLTTPHVAGHVPGHRTDCMRFAVENIANYFSGRPLVSPLKPEDVPS